MVLVMQSEKRGVKIDPTLVLQGGVLNCILKVGSKVGILS